MSPDRRLPAVDIVRGVTILWVTALHFYLDTRGLPGPELASGAATWDALTSGRVADAGAVAVRSFIGLPGFRLDLLLCVTALVASLGRGVPARVFYRRRLRAILPQYWLGSLAVVAVLVACAWLRSLMGHASLADELAHGSRLAGEPYPFLWFDVVRSLSVVGRLADQRAMQVVAPSLWYLVLVGQLLLVFPWLQRLHRALGTSTFLLASVAVTWAGRAWVFAVEPLPGFDANATVICFLPFRLIAPAIGMAIAAPLVGVLTSVDPVRFPAGVRFTLTVVAGHTLLAATWLGVGMNVPGTVSGILGPVPPLVLALPAMLWVAFTAQGWPHLGPVLRWAGTHSLSILVVQDMLRLVVGTVAALGGPVASWPWLALPIHLATVMLLARLWHPWPENLARRVDAAWPGRRPGPRSAAAVQSVQADGEPMLPALRMTPGDAAPPPSLHS